MPGADPKLLQIYFMGDEEQQANTRCVYNHIENMEEREIGEILETVFQTHNHNCYDCSTLFLTDCEMTTTSLSLKQTKYLVQSTHFPIHERDPSVIHLALHLENGQRIYFPEQTALQQALPAPKTTCTEFFNLCNRQDAVGHNLQIH
ncbi:ATP-dependent DNA helicase [Trichonephila clavipes]|nr:ATP-dependent DNA helicase [Trichonephila clavipes]